MRDVLNVKGIEVKYEAPPLKAYLCIRHSPKAQNSDHVHSLKSLSLPVEVEIKPKLLG